MELYGGRLYTDCLGAALQFPCFMDRMSWVCGCWVYAWVSWENSQAGSYPTQLDEPLV